MSCFVNKIEALVAVVGVSLPLSTIVIYSNYRMETVNMDLGGFFIVTSYDCNQIHGSQPFSVFKQILDSMV